MEINKVITAAITFIIALLVTFLFVVPAYNESLALQDTIVEKEGEYRNKSIYYEGIVKEFESIEIRRTTLTKVESALPQKVTFAPLVSFLQQKGIESGLAIKTLTFLDIAALSLPKPTAKGGKNASRDVSSIKTATFNVELVGTYQGLKTFLASLENSARLFQINTIGFSSQKTIESVAGAKSQLQIYTFTLQAKTYTY